MPVRRTPNRFPERSSNRPTRDDASLVRNLIEHALRCSMLSSLALGCSGQVLDQLATAAPNTSVLYPDPNPDAEVRCVGSDPSLASGFNLSRPVDYLADRQMNVVLSEAGEACANAADRDACEGAVRTPLNFARHLLTTDGDEVQIWLAGPARTLLGMIDTKAEAMWLTSSMGFSVPCDAKIRRTENGYRIEGLTRTECDRTLAAIAIDVSSAGQVAEQPLEAARVCPPPSPMAGRRPQGLRSQPERGVASPLGEHFAAMAHMEAASVPAFATIAGELHLHLAPWELIAGAVGALRDEVRHAGLTAGLALRHGAVAIAPSIAPSPARELEDFAIDNAVEGCVHEAYAALVALHQARNARDAWVRRIMRPIARDEARHALLSRRIGNWVMPRLGRTARGRVRDAHGDALAQLRTALAAADTSAVLRDEAGMPDARAALGLLHRVSSV